MKSLIAIAVVLGISTFAEGQDDLRRAMSRSHAPMYPNAIRNQGVPQVYVMPYTGGQPYAIHMATPFVYHAQIGSSTAMLRPAWQKSQRGIGDSYQAPNANLPYLNLGAGPHYLQAPYAPLR